MNADRFLITSFVRSPIIVSRLHAFSTCAGAQLIEFVDEERSVVALKKKNNYASADHVVHAKSCISSGMCVRERERERDVSLL